MAQRDLIEVSIEGFHCKGFRKGNRMFAMCLLFPVINGLLLPLRGKIS